MKTWEMFAINAEELYRNAPAFIAGIECEIESNPRVEKLSNSFSYVEDGSLRNNGKEFISIPLDKLTLLKEFDALQSSLYLDDEEEAFSPRTSIHVHVNCLNMDTAQVKVLLLLYALYEDFFFMMTKNRRDNIHCVPLTETYLPEKYGKSLEHLVGNWHKYTALNLLPLSTQGTVEFRHLHGTGDSETLKKWLNALDNLWELSRRVELTRESLSDEASIYSWWEFIFQENTDILQYKAMLPSIIKNSLLDVKLAFI